MSKKKKINENHYSEVKLFIDGISQSILVRNSEDNLNNSEYIKLIKYFVIYPVNLKNTSRKYYDLQDKKKVNFNNSKLRKKINEKYNFDDDSKFYMLKPSDEVNFISEWYKNGEFPETSIISMEKICIKNTYEDSKISSLFHFVRNCICHGNFEIVIIGKSKKYIVLEDNTGSIIRGRGCIMLKTLFDIVEVILSFCNE